MSPNAVLRGRISPYYALEDQVARVPPQHEIVWSRDGCYTYREFYTAVNRYAQFYLSLGLKPGDVLSFYLMNSAEFLIRLYACWAIGCYPSMINYNLTGEAILHCLRLGVSKVLLVDEDRECQVRVKEVLEQAEATGNRVIFFDKQKRAEVAAFDSKRPDDSFRANAIPGATSCLIFTSGTTGFPKACPFEMSRLYRSNVGRGNLVWGLPDGIQSRWYDCMPMYHGTGGILAMGVIAHGATVCVGQRFRASTFWDDIRDSQSTGFIYVGEIARYLVAQPKSPRDKDHKLKVVYGNGMRPDVWRQFRDRFGIELIGEFFSSTEGVFHLINRCYGDFTATAVGHHGALLRFLTRKMYVAALTDPNNSKELLRDREGRCISSPLTTGGEMLVAVPGKGLESGFAGYIKDDKATNDRFATDVFREGDVFYRSGDALRRDDDGRWFFLDRLGDTFRWKSENVSTAEVAHAVGEFPGVDEANVYGVLVPGHDGRAGCAALFIKGGLPSVGSFDWSGLAKHSRSKLPRYAVPPFVRVLKGELKGTHNHKQNKVPLREQGIDLTKVDAGDRVFWLQPDSDRYVEFRQSDWNRLDSKQARL